MDILDFLGHLKQFEKLENQSYWLFLEHNLILVNYPFSDPLYVLPHHTSSPNTSSPTPFYLSPPPPISKFECKMTKMTPQDDPEDDSQDDSVWKTNLDLLWGRQITFFYIAKNLLPITG